MEEAASTRRRKAKIDIPIVPIGYRFKARDDELVLDDWVLCKVYKKQGKGTTADEDEGEGDDAGAPPLMAEEEEEQQSSNTIAASPQISVNQKQQHQNGGGSEIMNQLQIAVDQKQNHQNGGSSVMNPSQLTYQRYNNMMLPQATYPPMLPYYYSNGYNAAASTSGLPDFPEDLGFGQDLPCYGNFVPTAAPISSIPPPPPPVRPTGSEYPLNMMIDDELFTDDKRNYYLDNWI
ncbi:hypothetical protein CCACVL1_30502 [Corchorus capsularis]|uniref:No apical meristem (NAM) protein n=1 Tax=Corchorus capsularis TaxID=210143 RepID=A0A1R3FWW3_COCAP|nr:hypothetical protein CCACVL1_30502 [Corchorus capsularis]